MGRNADAYLYTTVGPVDDESQTTRMVAKRIVSGAMSRSRDWVGAKQTFRVFIPAKTPCIINVHVYLWINFENKFSFPPFSRETQMRGGTCPKMTFSPEKYTTSPNGQITIRLVSIGLEKYLILFRLLDRTRRVLSDERKNFLTRVWQPSYFLIFAHNTRFSKLCSPIQRIFRKISIC